MSREEAIRTEETGKKKFSVFRLLLILVFSGVFVFSLIKVIGIVRDYHAGREIYEEVREVKTEREKKTPLRPAPVPAASQDLSAYEHEQKLDFLYTTIDYVLVPEYSFDFDALLSVNPEVVGWILIEGTYVDYPVVKGTDNAYYLRHAVSGEKNNAGSVFADYRIESPFYERNTVLYAHNQRNLQMFHGLLAFEKKDYLEEHPYVHIYLPDGSMQIYRIYSCHVASDARSYARDFADDQAFMNFIAYTKESALYDTGIPLFPESRILTLVTCTDDANEDRVVVHAVLVEHVPGGE